MAVELNILSLQHNFSKIQIIFFCLYDGKYWPSTLILETSLIILYYNAFKLEEPLFLAEYSFNYENSDVKLSLSFFNLTIISINC
jgi:hypothetical protein